MRNLLWNKYFVGEEHQQRRKMAEDHSWQPPLADVYTLANRCPLKYGNVVYAVRNLYQALTGTIENFSGDCNSGYAKGMTNKGMVKGNVTKIEVANKLLLYPNPANNRVRILYNKAKQIEIYDVMGRLVINQNAYNEIYTDINISQLKQGIYLVKVISRGGVVVTGKLIKK